MESLKKNADFKNCYQHGKSFVNRYLVMYVCGNGQEKNRVGISVSKEAYRLHEADFCAGNDIVFVARVRAKGIDYFKMEYALMQLVKKAGLLI